MSPDHPRVHPSAAVGFELAVADYEFGRPGFPDAAIRFLVERLRLGAGRVCVELGPGTGKLTELIVPSGVRIVGIEPVAAMRQAFARNVPAGDLVGAVAEELPLRDGAADAAMAAQAFIGSTAPGRSRSWRASCDRDPCSGSSGTSVTRTRRGCGR